MTPEPPATSPLLLRLACGLPLLALLSVAFLRTTQYARADLLAAQDNVPALEQALRLLPENAGFYARIATLDPTRDDALSRALVLNPRESSWWIMRSLQQEEAGDYTSAETSLRRAAQVADYFVPWWSLTAFYYRHANNEAFIASASHALSHSIDNPDSDPQSIFQMAANLNIPASVVQQQILPQRPAPVSSYLTYLLRNKDWSGAAAAGLNLARLGPERDDQRLLLLSASEQIFRSGNIDDAVRLWDAGIKPNGLTVAPLDPAAGNSLTDGSFTGKWSQPGFDWKMIAAYTVILNPEPGNGLHLQFDGRQPEDFDIFGEALPLLPNRQYRLTTKFRTHDLPADSGLRWRVLPVGGDHPPPPVITPSLSGEENSRQVFAFRSGPKPVPFEVRLNYSRRPGTTRIKGDLWLESLQLELLPEGK